MGDTLLFSLPEAPDRERRDTHWWHVVDGEVVSAGSGDEWLTFASRKRTMIGIAPAAQVRLGFADKPSTANTERQAEAVARVAAVGASLGDDQALHAASAGADDGSIMTAVATSEAMAAWLEWARKLGVDPDRVVPSAAILPLSDRWTAAAFGHDHVVGRRGTVLPDEPELTAAIVGDDQIEALNDEEVRSALATVAERPPIDLRTGRFARRRRIAIEGGRISELAKLAALIPLLLLAWALISIFKIERSTHTLDSETVAVASAALGKPVTAENAEAELSQRVGGSAFGGLMAPLTGVYQALQPEQSVGITSLSYAADGTLSVTFASPTVDAINRVLLSVQRSGYRVTAVPRQSPDGRSMVDVTVRSAA